MSAARRGTLVADLSGALAALSLLAAIAVGAGADHRAAAADERRAAALETAQNLLDAARHGATVAAPAGWTAARRRLADGVDEVRVRGPGIDLATLVTAAAPEAR